MSLILIRIRLIWILLFVIFWYFLVFSQNHVGFSYCYKLVSVDERFSKPFKSYIVQDAVHDFITSMTKEIKF